MIQRIQSVYLLVAAILVAVTDFFPLAHCFVSQQGFYTINSYGVVASNVAEFTGSNMWCWVSTAFSVVAFVFIVMALFGYKNRISQMKRCIYAILAILAYYVFFGIEVWSLNSTTGVFPSLEIIAEMPLIAIILIFLAGRAIKRDEDLVRSMDRIR